MKTKDNKKFLKRHKNIVSLFITIIFGILCIFSYQQTIDDISDLILIPVAAKSMGARTIITEDDIKLIEVPKCITLDSVYLSKEEVLGKYVKPYQSVSTNSLFYVDLLADKENMNDANLFSLQEGEVAISIDVDMKTSYANSILVGHMIDLYFLGKVNINDNSYTQAIVHGEIVKNARVIAVKDKEGNSIESNSTLESNVLVVALSKEDAHLVGVAKAMGSVTPVISYDNISQSESTDYYDYYKIRNIILGNSLDVTLIAMNEETQNE
ncbi:RcpC/CpaB family pilus assembly protein [Anaerorhabdus sp.]|uniref:RcpC/CpaB family pilus assembly protein n=1 Tax=Anaerorhabdus sp. TaxID=1872524 RepID=UPI002FC81F80